MTGVIYGKSRKLYGFSIVLNNVPGMLKQIVDLIAERNINIVRIVSTSAVTNDTLHLFIGVDLTNKKVDPEELKNEIAKIKGVHEIEVVESRKSTDILYDVTHFPLTAHMGTERAIVTSMITWKPILTVLKEKLGRLGKTLLFHEGADIGKEAFQKLLSLRKKNYEVKTVDMLEDVLIPMEALGWIKEFEVVNFKEKGEVAINIRIWNLWECEIQKPSKEPSSFLMKGLLAGYIAEMFNADLKDVKIEEVKCISKGDPYCEFKIELMPSIV